MKSEKTPSDDETEFIYDTVPDKLQKQLSMSKQKIKEAQQDKQNLSDQNKELQTQITRQTELLELKHKQLLQLQQEVQKVKSQLDDRELKLLQVVKEKQSVQNENINYSDIIHQLTNKNDNLNSEVFALKLTIDQQQQQIQLSKDQQNQTISKELRAREQIEEKNRVIQQIEDQKKKLQAEQLKFKQELMAKDTQLNELKRKFEQQQAQNQEIIAELISQKDQNLQASVRDYKPELSRLSQENEQLKNQLKLLGKPDQSSEVKALKERVLVLEHSLSEKAEQCKHLEAQLGQAESQKKAGIADYEQAIKDQELMIANLQQQLNLIKQQEQLAMKVSSKSIVAASDEKYIKEIQNKNEQVAKLQAENQQLVHLIETLKNQKVDNQSMEVQKIKNLESELKNLNSFVYDSPIVVLFNLLEDRLSKQHTKSLEHKNKIREYWTQQLKSWNEGLEELRQAFNGLKIFFKYELKLAPPQ